MENKKNIPATQQPLQQHITPLHNHSNTNHHVNSNNVYPNSNHMQLQNASQNHGYIQNYNSQMSPQSPKLQPNGIMQQLLVQNQAHNNIQPSSSYLDARSPLLENRQDLYGTSTIQDYPKHYGPNENYPSYPQSPQQMDSRLDYVQLSDNLNQDLINSLPKGYNVEVYKDYLKRNPPIDPGETNQPQQIYQPNLNQFTGKPYLPYTNRIPQSNTEMLRRQYNEIQQMKMQQQLHYQNRAQMQQQQTFAERQLLLQQVHGIQPPPNLQNSIYSDGSSYRESDRYSRQDDLYSPNQEYKDERYVTSPDYKDATPLGNKYLQYGINDKNNSTKEYVESDKYKIKAKEETKYESQSSNYQTQQKQALGFTSPVKSSDSSSPSVRSTFSESRRSSGGGQALRSPTAQRQPSAPVTMTGLLYKQGSDGLKVWRKRWFVLSEYCLFYYKSQDEEKLLGSVLLPSYKVSACTAEDKVLKKYAFKLEHANMRTYILAAPDQDQMIKWVKALNMAALMETPSLQMKLPQKQPERANNNVENYEDEDAGPTYANAPPKPRRSNEGFNSPSPDGYDPNYDLLQKPASNYDQGGTQGPPQMESRMGNLQTTNTCNQSFQMPVVHNEHQLNNKQNNQKFSLPLTNNVIHHRESNIKKQNSHSNYVNPQFENDGSSNYNNVLSHANEYRKENSNSTHRQCQLYPTEKMNDQAHFETKEPALLKHEMQIKYPDKLYERAYQANISETSNVRQVIDKSRQRDCNQDANSAQNRDLQNEILYQQNRKIPTKQSVQSLELEPKYGLNTKSIKTKQENSSARKHSLSGVTEKLPIERRTPDAYGRSPVVSECNRKASDYEDIYPSYNEDQYGFSKTSCSQDNKHKPLSVYPTSQHQFSGPSVLRRKKMQSAMVASPIQRPHSADFLEFEAKQEMLNKTMPARTDYEPPRQPQRPKSSLDINSFYDPSSDRYYSEESYAEKMRQSAQYLQYNKNIQIPLAKYSSGLAEKQLQSPYADSNYETNFNLRHNQRNASSISKLNDAEGFNSNWTLRQKEEESNKHFRNLDAMSSSPKDPRQDFSMPDNFLRSASARLPSATDQYKEGEKKIQQREESMKRLLEWKQRMLQSPLTRKSTPATISLARSLNQGRHSTRSMDYKTKAYTNATYNSYSSDDEDQNLEIEKTRETQAGRFQSENILSPPVPKQLAPWTPPCSDEIDKPINLKEKCHSKMILTKHSQDLERSSSYESSVVESNCKEVTYENMNFECNHTTSEGEALNQESVGVNQPENEVNDEIECDSEADSENIMEYTDDDLDEVLEDSDTNKSLEINEKVSGENISDEKLIENKENVQTPPNGTLEDHYLPMSPRKTSNVEPAHQTIINSLSVFDQTKPAGIEDNPYVEMNVGPSEEEQQAYEVVCVKGGKIEPVYMEVGTVEPVQNPENIEVPNVLSDTVANFADTKDLTLKRAAKDERIPETERKISISSTSEKGTLKNSKIPNSYNTHQNSCTDLTFEKPFNRFSISDNFRPASYYLGQSETDLRLHKSSKYTVSDLTSTSSKTNNSFNNVTNEALSRYVLNKLEESNLSSESSILKMLTYESQKCDTAKRKTSLMIHGTPPSIHDTLTRGEKIRHSRANISFERAKHREELNASLMLNSVLKHYNSNISIDTDSLTSFNADKASSQLSLDSDISSKFDALASNLSSEAQCSVDSDNIELRRSSSNNNLNSLKRRPISDESFFDTDSLEESLCRESIPNTDLDEHLTNLSNNSNITDYQNFPFSDLKNVGSHSSESALGVIVEQKYSSLRLPPMSHSRSASTPVAQNVAIRKSDKCCKTGRLSMEVSDHHSTINDSYSSCSSTSLTKSPISYYCKNYDGELSKNLNKSPSSEKVKQFDADKVVLRNGSDTAGSSTTTGFHSRESSTEHSAPYYYSDLSSQEQIDNFPASRYLKNTNINRKLNNQRLRGSQNKRNDISHIHNPIHANQIIEHDSSFGLVAAARSVSVEFLSAADKNPDIDVKNIYESSHVVQKIPESMAVLQAGICSKSFTSRKHETNFEFDSQSNNSHMNEIVASSAQRRNNSSASSENSAKTICQNSNQESDVYDALVSEGNTLWDEDSTWRDSLRKVSHRHARSMDGLDSFAINVNRSDRQCVNMSMAKVPKKICRNVTYVNSEIQSSVVNTLRKHDIELLRDNLLTKDENDVYVSLAEEVAKESVDEGVYEQLSMTDSCLQSEIDKNIAEEKEKKKFEIDREKLRQWDLMSSGLMRNGGAMGIGGLAVAGTGTDSGADSASNEASLSIVGNYLENNIGNGYHQPTLTKKPLLGSNTSIGRNTRDSSIPVRAVSPRVRWVEDKPQGDSYNMRQLSASQQNLYSDDAWSRARSPSRVSQQPIRAVSPRVRRHTESNDMHQTRGNKSDVLSHPMLSPNTLISDNLTAGELLGRTHEELVLLLIQLRRRHTATHQAMEQCYAQINSIKDRLNSLTGTEKQDNALRLEQFKMQLMELEHQYEKSKPLVNLVDNMVKLGSLYNKPGSTVERLERNQRLRQKILAERASEQAQWLENGGIDSETARARVSELWALERELADEANALHGLRSDKDAIESLLSGVRGRFGSMTMETEPTVFRGDPETLDADLARVHTMLAQNSKKLEETVADNARLERELLQLRRALQTHRPHAPTASATTALLEDEVARVQQLVSALQRQRQELSRAVRHLTHQSRTLQSHQNDQANKQRRIESFWQETNLDTGDTVEHGVTDYNYDSQTSPYEVSPRDADMTPLYVDTHNSGQNDLMSPLTSEEMPNGIGNLSNVEKQEIKTVRIVKRESERRHRDRERSAPPSEWPNSNLSANLDQLLEEELSTSYSSRGTSASRSPYNKYDDYYKSQNQNTNYLHPGKGDVGEVSPKYNSSLSLSNYDYSRGLSSLSSYNKSYDYSGHDRALSLSNQYLNSPTDSNRTLTNDPLSKTSSVGSLTRSNMELSPIFKSEAAKQIITEMSDSTKNGSLHRRQVPKEKRRHYTAPHHLSAKTLNEMPRDYYQEKMARSLDDADMERALRAPPDVVRSAIAPQRFAENTIDQLLSAPQKILIPERYIPEKPPELSPEEQKKREEKVESIKKMLSNTSADPNKSPDGEEKRQREHLLQMNQILAKQVMEMSKIVAEKALEDMPEQDNYYDPYDRSPEVELPIYQQRENYFS